MPRTPYTIRPRPGNPLNLSAVIAVPRNHVPIREILKSFDGFLTQPVLETPNPWTLDSNLRRQDPECPGLGDMDRFRDAVVQEAPTVCQLLGKV